MFSSATCDQTRWQEDFTLVLLAPLNKKCTNQKLQRRALEDGGIFFYPQQLGFCSYLVQTPVVFT